MDIAFLCGGEGTRLRPLTYVVPKPMLPIGPKPILEINITRARNYGFNRYFLMVNYKAEVISGYFGDGSDFNVDIQYFEEKERRGTAGPLSSLSDSVKEPFIVMNADVLTNLDLKQLIKFHKSKNATLTVALKHVSMNIPYGVATIDENDHMIEIVEKPIAEYLINAGIYCLSPEALDLIPATGMYQMPELMNDIRRADLEVLGYKFEESWRDIGRMNDYLEAFQESENGGPLGRFGSSF